MGADAGSAGEWPLVARSLASTSRYRDIPEVQRLEAVGSPCHVIVHEIAADATDEPRDYCTEHRHGFAELNVLLGEPGALVYDIVLGGETITATSPTTVWIPAGVEHSANLRRGTGTFVVVYLREPQDSSGG